MAGPHSVGTSEKLTSARSSLRAPLLVIPAVRGLPRAVTLLALLALLPTDSSAQASATLPPLDPVYEDLALLQRHGLIPQGVAALRPLSRGRVTRLLSEAMSRLVDDTTAGVARADLDAVLSRLARRFGPEHTNTATGLAEIELGGGRSPGREVPSNGQGELDVVLNPLWSRRGGRAYGDELTGAMALRGSVSLGSNVAIGVAGRGSTLRVSGVAPGRLGAVLDAAYLRVRLGSIALQMGRDSWWRHTGGDDAFLTSLDAPPLDLLRIVTDRPLSLRVLGDTEFALAASDLGPNQNFPHVKLFGLNVTTRPTSTLRLGLTLVNKQTGKGAPSASFANRVKDISFLWDLFRVGRDYTFSEKMVSFDAQVVLSEISGVELFGEIAFTDFSADRLEDFLTTDTGYRLGVQFPRLGRSQRHSVELEAALTTLLLFRHEQFLTGFAVDGFSQGSVLGPDGRRVIARYRYDAPASGWAAVVTGTLESRSVDLYEPIYDPIEDVLDPGTFPHERRARARIDLRRWLDRVSGIELALGVERVGNFAFESGAARTNGSVLVRVWRTF